MIRYRFSLVWMVPLLLFSWIVIGSTVEASPPKLPNADPTVIGMDPDRLAIIDDLVAEGLQRGRMPGAVVLVARRGQIVWLKAYGDRQIEPEEDRAPMTTDTVFDMASITKPVATATSIMKLVEMGRIHPRDPVSRYIPGFTGGGKEKITIYQLLTHQGGLIPDLPVADFGDGEDIAFDRIWATELSAKPGERFIYTDVGFQILGKLVERITGVNVHEFSQEQIFKPLGMTETGYLPSEPLRSRAAVTQEREGRWMRGEVHDPRAYLTGGIAGHAGLFSTAEDLAVYGQMMLGRGEYAGVRILEPETVDLMTDAYEGPGRVFRGLGWDKKSPYSSNRGDLFTVRAFGHGGFTGTVFWVDPGLELVFIFLSNRVHPDGRGSVNALAGRIATVAASAILDVPPRASATRDHFTRPSRSPVRTGIDCLVANDFRDLSGACVGLITNQTGVTRDGTSTAVVFDRAEGVELVALFSPEHGLEGLLDQSRIADTTDDRTGVRVYSLYGATRSPTPEMLQGIDTLVFDIQDIGSRFYTYIATMRNAMIAASEHDIRFVVLDRPNPINGLDVDGPMLDPGRESFVAAHRLPIRHGMTVGELARLFAGELGLDLKLQVIPIEGWDRRDYHDANGLIWVNPSPNMRSLNQALLYPGIGLLETTNMSVGRGTDTPFEVIGAPWLDGQGLAATLNALGLPGVRFIPIRFTPETSKYQNEVCSGINLIVTDRERFRSIRTGLEIARQLRLRHPNDWDLVPYIRLLGNQRAFEAVRDGRSVDEIQLITKPELDAFRNRREKFLLYP